MIIRLGTWGLGLEIVSRGEGPKKLRQWWGWLRVLLQSQRWCQTGDGCRFYCCWLSSQYCCHRGCVRNSYGTISNRSSTPPPSATPRESLSISHITSSSPPAARVVAPTASTPIGHYSWLPWRRFIRSTGLTRSGFISRCWPFTSWYVCCYGFSASVGSIRGWGPRSRSSSSPVTQSPPRPICGHPLCLNLWRRQDFWAPS